MPIQLTCPSCGKLLTAPDSAAGKRAKCPACGALVEIPEPIYDAENAVDSVSETDAPSVVESAQTPPDADAGRRPCPMCGEMIMASAVKCRYCGEIFDPALLRTGAMQGHIAYETERLVKEKRDKESAFVLFVTGLVGCFSPICAVYGIIFLVRRPYPFPRKGLAIAGTVMHCIWTLLLILLVASH